MAGVLATISLLCLHLKSNDYLLLCCFWSLSARREKTVCFSQHDITLCIVEGFDVEPACSGCVFHGLNCVGHLKEAAERRVNGTAQCTKGRSDWLQKFCWALIILSLLCLLYTGWGHLYSFLDCFLNHQQMVPMCHPMRCMKRIGGTIGSCQSDAFYSHREAHFSTQPLAQFKLLVLKLIDISFLYYVNKN